MLWCWEQIWLKDLGLHRYATRNLAAAAGAAAAAGTAVDHSRCQLLVNAGSHKLTTKLLLHPSKGLVAVFLPGDLQHSVGAAAVSAMPCRCL